MYERIKKLAKKEGISINALEKELGFARGYLSKINNHKPSIDKVNLLADYFNVPIGYINGESYNNAVNGGAVKIPVLGDVAAGIPIETIEDILDWEEISRDTARTGEFFGLKIRGDSMSPRILNKTIINKCTQILKFQHLQNVL